MQIVDGSLTIADISLSKVGKGVGGVTFRLSFTPSTMVPPSSAIQILLAGSAPQSLSANTVAFTSPSSGAAATASLAGEILTVALSSGTFSSGQLIAFSLPGTITNAGSVQPPLNNVSVSIVDSNNFTRSVNRTVFFHAIHDSSAMFSHWLTGFSTSSVGVKTAGSFRIQAATVGNVLVFTYPSRLFVSSRCCFAIKILIAYLTHDF